MSEVTLEQLEEQLVGQKGLVELRDVAIRLSQNRDFRKLILDGFCTTEAARYVQLSGDPALSAENRQDALNLAQASGHLKRFLSVTIQMGNTSANQIKELEQAIEEYRSEEGAE